MPSISGTDPALMYALANVMRAGATRANYTSARPFVSIAGTHYAQARDDDAEKILPGLIIRQAMNDTPDTCTFSTRGFAVSYGAEVIVTIGSKNNMDRLFAGVILTTESRSEGGANNCIHDVSCVDFTWFLTRYRVTQRYTSMSATDIALDLMTYAPSNFSTTGVEAGLETLDEFTVTNETILDALRRLAKRIGAYVDVSPRKNLLFGVSNSFGTSPRQLSTSHPTMQDFRHRRDISEMVTRVVIEGGGVNALTSVDAGDTILPVDNIVWYNENGGTVACGPQRLTYTEAVGVEGGSLVGPGAGPSSTPAVAADAGSGITSGTHQYAYTFVTGAGESLPSPVRSHTTFTISSPSAPTVDQTVSVYGTLAYAAGDTVDRKLTYATSVSDFAHESNASGVTTVTAVAPPAGFPSTANGDKVSIVHSTDPNVRQVHLWRQVNGGGYFRVYSQTNYPGLTETIVDSTFPSAIAFPGSTSNTYEQASVSGIAVGPTGTTQRKLYRTAAGDSQLKLLTTIANNTTTTYSDSAADGTLGANVPTSDTSGLSLTTGVVAAGSTSLQLAGAGAFSSDGGWAVIGNGQQVVRYTGIDGNTLTGIPSTGAGAIVGTIAYNSSATPAPCLRGIPSSGAGSIQHDISGGDPVNLIVFCESVNQALLAGLIDEGVVDDGVVEEPLVDRRLSETEARMRGEAVIALKQVVLETSSWRSRDLNTRAGRTQSVAVSVLTEAAFATLKIQTVTISDFHPELLPTFTAEASSQRYSFEDILRQLTRSAQTNGDHD